MATTRPGDPDGSLPQTGLVAGARSLRFVINPLVTHVRNHGQPALDFVVDKFKHHRVTTIGEQHAPTFSSQLSPTARRLENGCVRMFLHDLCVALHADSDARFRYLAFELDENVMIQRFGHWQAMQLPPGVVNRKAHWFAESGFAPCLTEVFRTIAQQIPEDQLEVMGIDHRVGDLAYERAGDFMGWVRGRDLQAQPGESPEAYRQRYNQTTAERQQRYTQASRDRDLHAADNFERMVLDHLGDDRALIYYGTTHLQEGPSDPGGHHYYSGISNRTFVRLLIERDNGLEQDEIYTIATTFPGSERERRSLSARELREEIAHEVQLWKILDVLRAEFPDEHNIGFDVDEARFAILPVDRSRSYPLGERYDGCLYFRDLNSWNGQTRPPADSFADWADVPDLSVTSVIPMRASPGNTIFVYGFVLTADTEVAVVTRGPNGQPSRYPCTDINCINENVLSVRVPSPGATPVGGQEATVELSRPNLPPRQANNDPNPPEAIELRGAFRYVIA
jgi:hypothetical protein